MSVAYLKNSIQGKILCLYGSPGVGKTSFAFSVAKALSRNVARISLGGESNATELKGHRKTYVASTCGKIIKSLIDTQSENCVIILDEIDKMGKNYFQGNPENALMEILDPEQNKEFTDNYLDFPVDLSKVFFICTANDISKISRPLLDRMELIKFNSYSTFEKEEIFWSHIYPQCIEDTGLTPYTHKFKFHENSIKFLIDNYSRGPGVRSLKKNTLQILHRIAFKILEEDSESTFIEITSDNIKDYIGLPKFLDNFMYQGIWFK